LSVRRDARRFRKVLIECGVLEPLCSLARSEDVELEIQRYAVLAIASKSHLSTASSLRGIVTEQ
jgi:hypothetical protein